MSKYKIVEQCGKYIISRRESGTDEYFMGYDFMGTADWTESILHSMILEMDLDEAVQIVLDLQAAD